VIDQLIDKSGLRQHYLADKEGQDRLENLDELINAATAFLHEEEWLASSDGEVAPDGGPLASFLAHASLEAGEHQAGEGEEAVQLMTVHAAKGLEFDVVFITGLEQGLFPHENAAQERDGLEEERRLMYVAVTRARHRLYLSHAQTRLLHGQTRYCLPSAFLDELPANAVAQDQPRRRPSFAGARPAAPAGRRRPQRRSADRPERAPCPVRRRGHRVHRRVGAGSARAGQFRCRRHEVAGARVRPADAGLTGAQWPESGGYLASLPTDCVDKSVEHRSLRGSSGSPQGLFCTCLRSGRHTRLSRYVK
jgi:hypothetical protein